jgi:hypothetical protein
MSCQTLPLFPRRVEHYPNAPVGTVDMKWKGTDILRLLVLVAVMLFFGTGLMIATGNTAGIAARWAFDILSALLFILIFFWLLAQEESLNQGN